MSKRADHFDVAPAPSESPFDLWMGRALKECFQDVLHEPIPSELVDLLPPPKPQR